MKRCIFALLTLFASSVFGVPPDSPEVLDVAILGLGGRAHKLLIECLKLKDLVHKEIRVVAVCDDQGQNSLAFYLDFLNKENDPLQDEYRKMFSPTSFYPDTEEGLAQLFHNHPHVDRVWVTSANSRHLTHLNAALSKSSCKDVFIEKPIFKNLDEFSNFQSDTTQATIHVGLTLRYAMMAKIAEQKLREYKSFLGRLLKVSSWEYVNFAHAWSIIMMNWRRYRSLSGGLLIEKSVHDLDLALFFMQAVDAIPQSLAITTETSHEFFKKSRKDEILAHLLQNAALRAQFKKWNTIPWQRLIPFSYDDAGAIDWRSTVDALFAKFPDDDALTHSDIIPDRHQMMAKIRTTQGDPIDFELQVKLNDFALITERGTEFTFEKGLMRIDIVQSQMVIALNDGTRHTFDLNTHGQPNAGGDVYVAHALLGTLSSDQLKAEFHDPAVQLSTVMGLVSEQQAQQGDSRAIQLTQVDGQWLIDAPKRLF